MARKRPSQASLDAKINEFVKYAKKQRLDTDTASKRLAGLKPTKKQGVLRRAKAGAAFYEKGKSGSLQTKKDIKAWGKIPKGGGGWIQPTWDKIIKAEGLDWLFDTEKIVNSLTPTAYFGFWVKPPESFALSSEIDADGKEFWRLVVDIPKFITWLTTNHQKIEILEKYVGLKPNPIKFFQVLIRAEIHDDDGNTIDVSEYFAITNEYDVRKPGTIVPEINNVKTQIDAMFRVVKAEKYEYATIYIAGIRPSRYTTNSFNYTTLIPTNPVHFVEITDTGSIDHRFYSGKFKGNVV